MKRAASSTPLERHRRAPSPTRRGGRRGPRSRGCRRRPGAYGQPPVPPVDASKQRTPGVEPGRHVREGRAARVVEVERDALERRARPRPPGRSASATWSRHADPDRVAEADLVGAELEQADARPRRPGRARRAGVRAAERGRDIARRHQPSSPARARTGAKAASDSSTVIPMLAVGEGVGRRGEDGDGVGAGGLGPGQAAHVRDEDRVADTRATRAGRAWSSSASASCGIARGRDEDRRLDLASGRPRRAAR